ncbi:MarR family winged helix-turn-helix transcriptional regulator [Puniceibacterium sp. IMCC21224]|uniref:MarR family winged helix-turn-helix transcriptional regulator n=1 Tax=Puniceibacterium sp. IMCC21224 TaxID=1618204 RepID=UPI00064D97F2|nr:MarR family winged helix-turn-helix transcriptional regulator [Puniceibacterium sp. IMCC21224]KMK67780.1 transcriptional regulator, MarR family [Puniceibacterium sp. IMCC21224]
MHKAVDPDALGFLIKDIARLMRAAFEREIDLAALTVTSAEAKVLVYMARCGAVRQHVLAEQLGLAPMSMTCFLDRLEVAGLVVRNVDPDDRRAKIVSLTDAAQDTLVQIAAVGQKAHAVAMQGFSDEEQAMFRHLAMKLRSNLDAARQDAACQCVAQKELKR